MIKDGQVGAIFNTVTRQISALRDQVMELPPENSSLFTTVLHGQRTVFPITSVWPRLFNLDAVKRSDVSLLMKRQMMPEYDLGTDGRCLARSALGT